jgi:hypothetical protein
VEAATAVESATAEHNLAADNGPREEEGRPVTNQVEEAVVVE